MADMVSYGRREASTISGSQFVGTTCMRCEVTRARLLSSILGLTLHKDEIVAKLITMIGGDFVLEAEVIWRNTHIGRYRIYG